MEHQQQENVRKKVIEVKGLKKSFNGTFVLNGIELSLCEGENLVIIGKSGTGKSVLIKCLVRLIEPDEGSMNILGKDIIGLKDDELTQYRRKVGFLFQGGALYDSMTVRENLLFPLKRNEPGLTTEEQEERILEMLQSVKLEKAMNKWPSELSGGMKNRIALARTLVLRPEIIFYDEPTAGLDAVTSKEISNLILEMQKEHNVSSIIITHDISCVRITSNRINMLREGKIADEGDYDDLKSNKDPWIRAFFND